MKHPAMLIPGLVLALLVAAPAGAEIYRKVDADGNVTYTNTPGDGATPVELKPLTVYDAPPAPSRPGTSGTGAEKTPAAPPYRALGLVSPVPEQTLRSNPGNIELRASSTPALRPGDHYQFYLDGAPVGERATSPSVQLQHIDRGEHRAEVAIVDARGQELIRSKPVVFYLHRQTLFNPARQGGG